MQLARTAGFFLLLMTLSPTSLQKSYNSTVCNCSTTEKFVSFIPVDHPSEPKEPEYRKSSNNLVNHQDSNYQISSKHYENENSASELDLQVHPINDSGNSLDVDLKVYPLEIDKGEKKSTETTENHRSDEDITEAPFVNKNPNDVSIVKIIDHPPASNYEEQYPRKSLEEKPSTKKYDMEFSKKKLIDQLMNRDDEDDKDHLSTIGELVSQNTQVLYTQSTKNIDLYDQGKSSTKDFDYRRQDESSQVTETTSRHSRYSEKPFDSLYTNKYLDDLQPDKRVKDQDYEQHIVDQYPDRRLSEPRFTKSTTIQQPNRRIEEYDRRSGREDDRKSRVDDDYVKYPVRELEGDNRKWTDDGYDRHLIRDLDDEHRKRDDKRIAEDRKRTDDGYDRHPVRDLDDEDRKRDDKRISEDRKWTDDGYDRHPVKDLEDEDRKRDDKKIDDDGKWNEKRVNDDRLVEDKPRTKDDDYRRDHKNVEETDKRPGGARRLGDENYDQRVIDIDKTPKESSPDRRYDDKRIYDDDEYTTPRRESNVSHLLTYTYKEWEESKPKLNFPKKSGDERYRMASLHLDKGFFLFDFLRTFLSVIQPRTVPLDLLKDALEGKISIYTLFTKTIHIELIFMTVIVLFAFLMFVIPGTECYLCCRPAKYKNRYKDKKNGSSLCFLTFFAFVMGSCVITMLICNEEVASGIEKIPETIEAALQDLRDYHAGTAVQLRKCLTRSLDVASEAILADLDNVEELLGKPIQSQLSQETGVDVALEQLMEVSNASMELAYKTDNLLRKAERAREFGNDLSHEADEIRRDLERTTRDCAPEDRSLCAVLDPSGLHLALRLDRVARDDRLIRLRQAVRDNLTEAGRQARGEYLYVTHHIARTTLDARNKIRREINTIRSKVRDDARGIEGTATDLTNHLDKARRLTNEVVPYIQRFEQTRWIVGFGTAMCVMFIWVLLFGALCCRCGSSEGSVRPTLLWFACLSCIVSILLWVVLMASLAVASHTEMLLCRPLDDPEFRTVEAVLETKYFLGKRLGVPLKDLLEKCDKTDSMYPAYQLDNTAKLEEITAHWTWSGLTRAFSKLKVDLSDLRIVTPNLRDRLQNLYYATGPNLTEHRVMIQGPILNKDLNALSDQVENVARQLSDRRTARSFQSVAQQMRELLSRRVKPLMKMQDELVYQLATLELHLQPLQHKVNHTLNELRNVQYYIDNQGEKIGQLKTKAYIDRMGNYLDQWRAHVLVEVSTGMSKCRPLWDILRGLRLLFCNHILGPFNGYWFATFVCVVTMLIGTPTAHRVASSYWGQSSGRKGSILLPSRQGSPDTVVMERDTWRSPDPPSSMESW